MVQTLDDRPGTASPGGPLPPLSPMAGRADSSAIRDLLALSEQPGIISLAGGKPAPDTFPVEALRHAADAVLARDGAAALQYSPTEGYRPLREWVAGMRGTDVERVTVTTGSQQGLDLVARALAGPGDVVVSAEPGYVGALQAFRLAGAALVGVASDGDGLRVDDLADRLAAGLRPALVYLVADLSNPTGATLSAEHRDALVALAERYGFWVVEDDPYGALRWRGHAPRPLFGRSGHVVTLGTVSKVLCPGLRVGYVLAPPVVSQAVVRIKQAADLHTATLSQRLVHELVATPGFLADHLATLPGRYRERAGALTGALRAELGERLAFAEPEGGMFLWAQVVDPAVDTTALLDRALAAGVAFVPGRAFAVERTAAERTDGASAPGDHPQRHDDHLRLSFANATPDELGEAARRLAVALGTA